MEKERRERHTQRERDTERHTERKRTRDDIEMREEIGMIYREREGDIDVRKRIYMRTLEHVFAIESIRTLLIKIYIR